MASNLYLIALIPGEELRDQVRELKMEIKDRFNASHALKAPAHITLQMPFRRDESEEHDIVEKLGEFSSEHSPFEVSLNGFDAFPPRVIFLEVTNHKPIKELHSALNDFLKTQLGFIQKEINDEIHPHMTIATRDLSKNMFHRAWPDFENRSFEATFRADHLHLLKHNGKHWELHKEFSFGVE